MRKGKLAGLIDWEHAGEYCLAWELRKLPRFMESDWQWNVLLSAYGCGSESREALVGAARFLDLADLLGHLRWCISRGVETQASETRRRMDAILKAERR